MNTLHDHHKAKEKHAESISLDSLGTPTLTNPNIEHISTTSLLPPRGITHHSSAGMNPIVDAAAYLFSALGKLKTLTNCHVISRLQHELIHEINTFQSNIQRQGYPAEYIVVCRFVLCATIDEILSHTKWGSLGLWEHHFLLKAFNQDTQHEDKFFTLIDRVIKEPANYIDLMELMYICLSMGYKGQYRASPHGTFQLEQITHQLYKHIRAYRGSINKTLSPASPHSSYLRKKKLRLQSISLPFIFILTACAVMALFLSLGYLMDVVSNEATQNIAALGNTTL